MFKTLQPWLTEVLSTIKKEIKTEHLPSNPSFHRTHFGSRPINRLTSEEIFSVYEKELLEGNTDLGEWVVNRWVFRNGELYSHFAERLSQVNPEFSEIKSLTEEESARILAGAVENFGPVAVYLFSLLNGVVFPAAVLEKLSKQATEAREKEKKDNQKHTEEQSLLAKIEQQNRELARFESRLAGVQKKYTTDVEALKKQIRALQQQLHGR